MVMVGEYGGVWKRMGSLLQQQARANSVLKTARTLSYYQNHRHHKENLGKLKRMLLACLLENNIIEPKDIKVKKHFLRFGK